MTSCPCLKYFMTLFSNKCNEYICHFMAGGRAKTSHVVYIFHKPFANFACFTTDNSSTVRDRTTTVAYAQNS